MHNESIYKTILLDHFHNPRNKGNLENMDAVHRGSNPRCGDEIEIGIHYQNTELTSVRFRGRGCSICLASASMMCECTTGLSRNQARQLIEQMREWFTDTQCTTPPTDTRLAALESVRQHSARRKCVLLAWQALDDVLNSTP